MILHDLLNQMVHPLSSLFSLAISVSTQHPLQFLIRVFEELDDYLLTPGFGVYPRFRLSKHQDALWSMNQNLAKVNEVSRRFKLLKVNEGSENL